MYYSTTITELSFFCLKLGLLQLRLGNSAGVLCSLAVLDKHRDTNHGQPKPVRERATSVPAHHAAELVVIDELAEQARARQPCERAQIDRRLGVPAPREHAAGSRAQGHHVSRTREVLRVHADGRCERTGRERAVVR